MLFARHVPGSAAQLLTPKGLWQANGCCWGHPFLLTTRQRAIVDFSGDPVLLCPVVGFG